MAKLEDSPDFQALSMEQQLFCQTYLSTRNATEAYQKVKPSAARTSCAVQGARWLKDSRIQGALAYAQGSGVVPDSQFWAELKRALEQDKSWSVKMNALRLIAEIKGWVVKSGKAKIAVDAIEGEDVVEVLSKRMEQLKQEGML